MAQGPEEAVAAVRRSHDQLASFVEAMGPEDLERQSGASEWTVADVLSHLGSAAEIGLHTLTTGKADMAAAPAIWDRWNAMSPREKAANFEAAGARLVEALAALDDEALASDKVDVGFLPAPVDIAFFAGMRLSEVALHTWDIHVAFDPTATVPDYLVPFVLGQLPLFAGFFAKSIGKVGTVAITTTDPAGSYILDVHDDGAGLEDADGADGGAAATHVSLPAEALVRLTGGRLGPDHTPLEVTIEGDLGLEDLRRVFPGY